MFKRPLFMFAVWWVAGSAAACLYSGGDLLLLWLAATCLHLAYAMFYHKQLLVILVMWSSLSLAGAYWEWNDSRNVSSLPALLQQQTEALNEISVKGRGYAASSIDVDGYRADMDLVLTSIQAEGDQRGGQWITVNEETVKLQIRLASEEEQQLARDWQRGDEFEINGTLVMPAGASNFGGFDYQNYLRTKEIHWLIKVKGLENVTQVQPEQLRLLSLLRWNDQIRGWMSDRIDLLFGEPHAGYVKGLVIGMREDLDTDTFSQFSTLGLTHILAISGMHVAVFVGSLLYVMSLLRVSRETSLTIALCAVPLYVLLTGFSPSVIRAGIMGMIGLYAARKGLLKDGLNILSAAALLMLVWNPYYLLDVSFQLSFLVTLGLMVYVPMIMPLLKKLPTKLAGAVGVTLVAQLVSFPLTITYFNQFSLLSFAANLILVPLITLLVLPLATIALLAGSLWLQGGQFIAMVVEWLDHLTFSIVEWMNGYSVFVTIWPSPSLTWTISYYIVMYMLLFFAKRWVYDGGSVVVLDEETVPLEEAMRLEKNNHTGYAGRLVKGGTFACILIYSCLLYFAYQPEHPRGEGLVQFLDIGQGDSILITTPGGANLLVDGGGTMQFGQPEEWSLRKEPFEVGAKVVVPLLKKRGIHALDAVILTHGDHDHAGGLQAVLEQIPVRSLLFNGTMGSTESVKTLFSTAIAKDIPIYAAQEGMVLKPDSQTELVFIYPEASAKDNGVIREVKKQNHASLVFMLRMQERSFLFTGDIEQEGETDILHKLTRQVDQDNQAMIALSSLKQVDVMKIAHHGSKTSTTAAWLERWRPRLAVVSAGRNNSYGHPNEQVVERILEYGASLYQTNQHGEVQIRVKDGALWLRHKQ